VETEPRGSAVAGWAQDAGRSECRAVIVRIEVALSGNIASDPERVADVQRVFDGENPGADTTTGVVE